MIGSTSLTLRWQANSEGSADLRLRSQYRFVGISTIPKMTAWRALGRDPIRLKQPDRVKRDRFVIWRIISPPH